MVKEKKNKLYSITPLTPQGAFVLYSSAYNN